MRLAGYMPPATRWAVIRSQFTAMSIYITSIPLDEVLRLALTLEKHLCPATVWAHYSIVLWLAHIPLYICR